MTNNKRNHKSFIFEEIIMSIKSAYFFIILAILNLKTSGVYVLIAIALFSIIKSILKYINIKYYYDDSELKYFTGIINKKQIEIPFDKINTIDINLNIVDRIFNVCTLKIDTGAVKELGEEIKIKLVKEEAYKIRSVINDLIDKKDLRDKDKKEDVNKSKFKETITFKEIFLYSLSKSKLLWAIGGFFIISDLVFNIEDTLNITITDTIIESVNIDEIYALGMAKIVGIGIIIFIILYIFISFLFIIFELIRLYNFTLIDDENDIKIKYGLLTIKEYSIPRNKIYAVRYKQNLLQQIFKIFQIEIVTIGYGDEKNEQAILYPVANKVFINTTLKEILPDFNFEDNINCSPKNVLSKFIIKRSLILILFLILPLHFIIPKTLLILKIVIFTFLIIFNIILGYINYRNTSLGINKDLLRCSNGSLQKITTLIKQEYLQSVEIKENPFQRRKSVCDFKLDIYSNKIGNIVILSNMEKILINHIDENLIL
ncbi:Bacterial membrane flanked domain protein [Clostridium tertium]|uniref:Bacterial membrane flanked domain protein n=1 Tax=Clostridium tertium TaxID=1559 RepID=A0A6N2YGJ3_9CLOT